MTPEIIATGGTVAGVSLLLFQRLDNLRENIGLPVMLLPGGLNSGHHISNTDVHAQGLAADFYFTQSIDYNLVFWAMIDAGFKGIGLYWNGTAPSYHADVRPTAKTARWIGLAKPPATEWTYLGLELSFPPTC